MAVSYSGSAKASLLVPQTTQSYKPPSLPSSISPTRFSPPHADPPTSRQSSDISKDSGNNEQYEDFQWISEHMRLISIELQNNAQLHFKRIVPREKDHLFEKHKITHSVL
jgi:hypothetical protein